MIWYLYRQNPSHAENMENSAKKRKTLFDVTLRRLLKQLSLVCIASVIKVLVSAFLFRFLCGSHLRYSCNGARPNWPINLVLRHGTITTLKHLCTYSRTSLVFANRSRLPENRSARSGRTISSRENGENRLLNTGDKSGSPTNDPKSKTFR